MRRRSTSIGSADSAQRPALSAAVRSCGGFFARVVKIVLAVLIIVSIVNGSVVSTIAKQQSADDDPKRLRQLGFGVERGRDCHGGGRPARCGVTRVRR
jgi:hypothetical protein